MSKKPDEKEENPHMPRWKDVSDLYDILDKAFVDYGQEHDMTFMEMDLVLYMLNEKILQQKVMTLGIADAEHIGINGNSGMYR